MGVQTAVEAAERAEDKDHTKNRFNALIAVTIAIIAALMAVSNVKDGNINQAMQQAQADSIDHWSWYQSHKSRIETAESTLTLLELQPESAKRQKAIDYWKSEKIKQESEAKDIKTLAEKDAADYYRWNLQDDQFDASEALLSLSITLLAMTSLTQKKWLYVVAIVPAGLGATMAIAGLFNLSLHSDWLAKVLGV